MKLLATMSVKLTKRTLRQITHKNSSAKSTKSWRTFKKIVANGVRMLTVFSSLSKEKRSYSTSSTNSLLMSNKYNRSNPLESLVFLARASFRTRQESHTMETYTQASRTLKRKKVRARSRTRKTRKLKACRIESSS